MAETKNLKHVHLVLGLIFAFFLILNAIFDTIAFVAKSNEGQASVGLPADTSPAVRLLMFLIGAVVSWLLGGMLYRFLIKGTIPVSESTNTACVLVFYFVLTFATFAFLGVLAWFWLPLLFLVLLIFSVITLWGLLGGVFTTGAVVGAFAAAFVTFYLLS
jgi:hypothetical protein